jgi:hypothetical protein
LSAPEPQDDVQEFAALLRRLKERTDRSYGSLARRLNMNTSTLHRYCAGDAVPVDFAPVERFAALCGASPEERMDLHRLWLSAVAARQRPRAGETAEAPGTVDETGEAGEAGEATAAAAGDGEAVADDAAGVSAADEGAAGMGAPDHNAAGVSAPDDSAAGMGAPDHNAAGVSAPDHSAAGMGAPDHNAAGVSAPDDNAAGVSAPDDSAAGVSAADDGAAGMSAVGEENAAAEGSPTAEGVPSAEDQADALVAGRGAAAPGRPWYRRRRVAVTAAAAVALLATLGSLSALPSGRSASDEVAQAPDPSSPTTASGTPGRSPSKSPSPSTTSGSPSPRGPRNSPSPSATGGGGAPSKGTGGSGQQGTATGTPLTWTVNSHIWNAGCGHDYVIDKPPAQVPPPPTSQDAANWAGTLGAIHGKQTMVQISVQGRNSTAVVLEDLRVRVVSRGTPATGNSYAMEQGCGGALTPRYFSVNLDKDRPIAHSQSGNDGENVIPAVRMPYRVSAEDPEILLVTAETENCDCSWYLELDWSSQGRTGTARVDDHGRPFRTTGIKGLPRYWYGTNTAGERAWVDYDG